MRAAFRSGGCKSPFGSKEPTHRHRLRLPLGVGVLLLGLLWGARPATAQLTGTTSLVTIPVAEMPGDGVVTLGGGFVDKKYSEYLDGRVHYTPLFVSLGFLPFLEVGFRFSRPVDLDDRSRLGDRMVMARLRVLSETPRRPALVIGMHDFLTVQERNYFNALYAVASKHVASPLPVALHLGYGSTAMDALAHQFAGVFGGVAVSVAPFADLLVEYDGDRVNAGGRVTLFDTLRLLVALRNLDTPEAGASVRFRL